MSRKMYWIFDLGEAYDILRLDRDGAANDETVIALVEALPAYLEASAGYRPDPRRGYSHIAKTAGRFILQQWYYGENADATKLQRVIDSLLKALSAERKA